MHRKIKSKYRKILRLSKRGKSWKQVKSSKAIWTTKVIIRLKIRLETYIYAKYLVISIKSMSLWVEC